MGNLQALRAPFRADQIYWRIGATTADKSRGMALAYIDARAVMDRLDEVCGPENWQKRYSHADAKTICEIGIKIGNEWVWKADGAGDTDHEAAKGALSDAFKRAGVVWGIGRYLYDLSSPWVEIEQAGKSYKIKPAELTRLAKMIETLTGPGKQTISDDGWDTPTLRDWCRSQFPSIKTASECVDWWNSQEVANAFDSHHATQRDADAAKKELGQHRRNILDAPRHTNGSSRLSARA